MKEYFSRSLSANDSIPYYRTINLSKQLNGSNSISLNPSIESHLLRFTVNFVLLSCSFKRPFDCLRYFWKISDPSFLLIFDVQNWTLIFVIIFDKTRRILFHFDKKFYLSFFDKHRLFAFLSYFDKDRWFVMPLTFHFLW